MKKDILTKVQADIEAWTYLQELPLQKNSFELHKLMREVGDTFQIYCYENEELKRKTMIYYHEETNEYKLLVTIGLTEFCAIEFISANLEQLQIVLDKRFDLLLGDISAFKPEHISSLIVDKKIMEWDYIEKFPQELCGFKLFIKPSEPVKIINGSYIILDYSDFANESNFIIYYNVFRDEFFGEAKIHRIPEVTYAYDSSQLDELKQKIEEKLLPTLEAIRKRI